MSIFRVCRLAGFCLPILAATHIDSIPLSFQQREPALFVAPSGQAPVRLEPNKVTVGGVTLRFEHSLPARLEGVGPAAPATYIDATGARTFSQYSRLAMRGVYPGIDAIFYGHDGHLEFDLAVAPGASLSRLRLRFENARNLRLRPDGSLAMETPSGQLEQLPPKVFQSNPVAAHYVLTGDREVAIRLGRYNHGRPLTIDPELVYEKLIGGTNFDTASAVATDSQGNIYLAGSSSSLDFPAAPGSSTRPLPPLVALTNAGQTIAQLPIGNGSGVAAIAGTPDGSILYAAAGSNIYYSKDGGATWKQTGSLPAPVLAPVSSPLQITDISVDAIDPSRAYIATNRGLFSTSDNGADWFPRDYDLAAYYDGSIHAAQVAVSQVDHTILYATTGTPNFLYRSADAGNTWTQITPSFPGEPVPPPFPISQTVFTLVPGGSDLYAVDPNSYLFKTADGGSSWQKLAYGLFGAVRMIVDPKSGAIFVQDNYGLQKSTDGGFTFTTINPPGIIGPTTISGFTYESVSGTIYVAAAQSMYASTDQGATWKTVPLQPANIHVVAGIGGRTFVGLDTPQTTYVVKYDPTGSSLIYSTFFTNRPIGGVAVLRVDAQGSAYMAGTTYSQNFAGATKVFSTTPAEYLSGFVAKLSPDGTTLAYLSLIGGTRGVSMNAMALDSSGAVYVSGISSSPDYPTTPGALQPALPATACARPGDPTFLTIQPNQQSWAFVSKISPDGGSLVYSTFLTGSCGSAGQAIAVNSAGEAFVAGSTTSPDFPVSPGAYQAAFPGPTNKTGFPNALTAGFAVRLSSAGDRVLSGTYIGGGFNTSANAITLDPSGNPIVTGGSWGITPGATPGAYQNKIVYNCQEPIGIFGPPQPPSQGGDAYVLKLDPGFTKAAFLTYLGGSCADLASSVALDANGDLWVSGPTNSSDFPTVSPFLAEEPNTGFIAELSPDASKLLFSSYSYGTAFTIDPHGFVYVAGASNSPSIPKNNAANGLLSDAVLDKIDSSPNPAVEIDRILNIALSTAGPKPLYTTTAVAPGEMVRIQGQNLGPAAKTSAQLDAAGRLPFLLANTRVLFDGVAAALNSVQANEIDCFVPFAVSRTTRVTVISNGQTSNTLGVQVTAVASGILAVFNQDGTPNTAANPAKQGSVVVVYVTGLGQTAPPSIDGATNAAPAAIPIAPVTVYVGQYLTLPQFAAAAVGSTAGIYQVNVAIPVGQYPPNGASSLLIDQAGAALYVVP